MNEEFLMKIVLSNLPKLCDQIVSYQTGERAAKSLGVSAEDYARNVGYNYGRLCAKEARRFAEGFADEWATFSPNVQAQPPPTAPHSQQQA
jgi:hypothetical protein